MEEPKRTKSKRLELLKEWQKQKKMKKEQDKQKEKPIFKVAHVNNKNSYDLSKIYSKIKGKPISTSKIQSHNIEIVQNTKKNVNKKIPETTNGKLIKTELQKNKNVTQTSMKVSKKVKNNENEIKRKNTKQLTKLTIQPPMESIKEDDVNNTKATSSSESVTYVSPFVTVSRGKSSARKEFKRRIVHGGSEPNDIEATSNASGSTSPETAAKYFLALLYDQIKGLQGLISKWKLYEQNEKPTEEACCMIQTAIGQTELLINKKFQQFRGLIDVCISGEGEKPVTCMDLHGFWDMVLIQVKNIEERFQNLDRLNANNWEEVLPEPVDALIPKIKKEPTRKRKPTANSNLKAAIRKARKNKFIQQEDNNLNFVSITPKTPKRKSSKNDSLLKSVRFSKPRFSNSPGLIMKATLSANKNTPHGEANSTPTPKSILKSSSKLRKIRASLFNKTKIVIQENDKNVGNISTNFTPRRSTRLLLKQTIF